MPLSLSETRATSELAKHLYDYLPGRGFASVAAKLGLGSSWLQGGSKLPNITTLLQRTLEFRRGQFCDLILAVVREGLTYSVKEARPITREAIEELNQHVRKVGFKIPELWDPLFLSELPRTAGPLDVEQRSKSTPGGAAERLAELRETFLELERLSPQERGFAFERFLCVFFAAYGLSPRSPFRIRGEQIDGSIDFENVTYLVEAKWQVTPVGQADLLVFQGKVTGKTTWSRGLFISIGGFSADGVTAFAHGRPSSLIAIDGQDLYYILTGEMSLPDAIRFKSRRAAETGDIMVPIQTFLLGG
jgi:hypothetical protein